MKKILSIILLVLFSISTHAQIGYQVALLNHANGEPRKNETVSVKVEITNSSNDVIYSQTQSATTNDFGLISLTIGNADTFKDVDWSKLPLYVSATVDDVLVGKTQILNVPVAEYAKKADSLADKSIFSLDELLGKWEYTESNDKDYSRYVLTFNADGTATIEEYYTGEWKAKLRNEVKANTQVVNKLAETRNFKYVYTSAGSLYIEDLSKHYIWVTPIIKISGDSKKLLFHDPDDEYFDYLNRWVTFTKVSQ